MAKCVLCYSGGLDSTVLLYHLKYKLGNEVKCLSIDYGQKHRREILSASDICIKTGTEHRHLDLGYALQGILSGSSQTSVNIPVPEGHYAEENMKQTVVPNRNMILLALAGAWAVSSKSEYVAFAAHAGDHAIYPDCRPFFANTMATALRCCDWHEVNLIRPFVDKSKADIVKLGAELQVPFELTWSCYNGREKHCGKCSTCVERLEAFAIAGMNDPTDYEDKEFYKGVIK